MVDLAVASAPGVAATVGPDASDRQAGHGLGQLEGADVAAGDAVALAVLEPVDAALVGCRASVAAAAGSSGVGGVEGGAVG